MDTDPRALRQQSDSPQAPSPYSLYGLDRHQSVATSPGGTTPSSPRHPPDHHGPHQPRHSHHPPGDRRSSISYSSGTFGGWRRSRGSARAHVRRGSPRSSRPPAGAVMSLARLSAGSGYKYLLRHTACGDACREPGTPLTAYYAASGYPAGRWLGTGLTGVDGGQGLAVGTVVTEEAMAALYGSGPRPGQRQAARVGLPGLPFGDDRIAEALARPARHACRLTSGRLGGQKSRRSSGPGRRGPRWLAST